MTLFIQSDAGSDGTGTVFPAAAAAHLFIIGNMDPKLGETQLSNPADLIEVTYPERTQPGFPPERLFELVNTKFTEVPADPTDIIILAVEGSFILTNGELVSTGGGVTLPPKGSGESGAGLNPTESVLVIYEKEDASGFCDFGLVSKAFDLPSPPPVTLFHELSHAFRQATKKSLSLAFNGCEASSEEKAAEEDENKMREQLKGPLRDATNHCGAPCGTKAICCIVASIATGSQSIELNALRQLREGFLRRSEVGFDFFERLHYDYYAFSPQVCAEMGRDASLLENVATYYVKPLRECLELARARLIEGASAQQLGERMAHSIPPELQAIGRAEITAALGVLGGRAASSPLSPPGKPALPVTPVIASQSLYVRWALIDTIRLYLLALRDHQDGLAAIEVGKRLARRLDAWAAGLPVTDIWAEFSEYEVRRELDFLGSCLLRSPTARGEFAKRLRSRFCDDERLPRLLATTGYLEDEPDALSPVEVI